MTTTTNNFDVDPGFRGLGRRRPLGWSALKENNEHQKKLKKRKRATAGLKYDDDVLRT
jgi:hypothetical protein